MPMRDTTITGGEKAWFILCFLSIMVLESYLINRTSLLYRPFSFSGSIALIYFAIQIVAAKQILSYLKPKWKMKTQKSSCRKSTKTSSSRSSEAK